MNNQVIFIGTMSVPCYDSSDFLSVCHKFIYAVSWGHVFRLDWCTKPSNIFIPRYMQIESIILYWGVISTSNGAVLITLCGHIKTF